MTTHVSSIFAPTGSEWELANRGRLLRPDEPLEHDGGKAASGAVHSLPFPTADGPTTPFPHRVSVPPAEHLTPTKPFPRRIPAQVVQQTSPTTPFPNRSSVPYPTSEPSTHHHSSPQRSILETPPPSPPRPSAPTPSRAAPRPPSSPSLTPRRFQASPSLSSLPTTPFPTASPRTSLHLIDFAPDPSVDRLCRGRLVPITLSGEGTARFVLHVRVDPRCWLFPECGVLLDLEPGTYTAELVIVISDLEPVELAKPPTAQMAPAAPVRWKRRTLAPSPKRPRYPSLTTRQLHGPDAAGRTTQSTETSRLKEKVKVEHLVAGEDTAYLTPLPGPGFLNWLLASVADILATQPKMSVTFVGVESWDPRWIRPHWVGAIAADLLRGSRAEMEERSTMEVHLHSGVKMAGMSQWGWSRDEAERVRRERVRYMSAGEWEEEMRG